MNRFLLPFVLALVCLAGTQSTTQANGFGGFGFGIGINVQFSFSSSCNGGSCNHPYYTPCMNNGWNTPAPAFYIPVPPGFGYEAYPPAYNGGWGY